VNISLLKKWQSAEIFLHENNLPVLTYMPHLRTSSDLKKGRGMEWWKKIKEMVEEN
jgi:hypothetical protein